MNARAVVTTALEGVEVECTHCGIRMSTHLGSSQQVRYFRCASCHRWVSSAYTEVFRADAKVRTHAIVEGPAPAPAFDAVKDRLDRWLSALEDQDPYRALGVSPLDPPEKIRDRYRELALSAHPDRGGSAERMRDINLAYERITTHLERRRA
ncbi:MAG: J domain-containing protein, partial [Myxococcaceae bacterium]